VKAPEVVDTETGEIMPQGEAPRAIMRAAGGALPEMVAPLQVVAQRRKEFEQYVNSQLHDGVDFGKIPGTGDRKNLLKPGAEKIMRLYGIFVRFEIVEKVEDWNPQAPFFRYLIKAKAVWHRPEADGTTREVVVGECIGECNSRESKYGYRWLPKSALSQQQKLRAEAEAWPEEGQDTWRPFFTLSDAEKQDCVAEGWKQEIRKSKAGKDVNWTLQPALMKVRVPNLDVADQVNTLVKMCQKRAMVGLAIQVSGASDLFTQDMEERAAQAEEKSAPAPMAQPAPAKAAGETPGQEMTRLMTKIKKEFDTWDGPSVESFKERVLGSKNPRIDLAAARKLDAELEIAFPKP
jgi:hypothetical protein